MQYTAQIYVANQSDTYAGIAALFNIPLSSLLEYNCLSGNEGILGFERFLIPTGDWKKHRHVVRHIYKLFRKKHGKRVLIKVIEYNEANTIIPMIALFGIKKHKIIPRKLLTSISLPGFTACELYPLAALEEFFGSYLNCSCMCTTPSPNCCGCNNLLTGLGAPCGMCATYAPFGGATGTFQLCNPCNQVAPCGPCGVCTNNVPFGGATGTFQLCNPCNQVAPCYPYGPTWDQVNCCNNVPYQGLLNKISQGC
jgi:hypothetical protein